MTRHLRCLDPTGYTGIDPETGDVVKAKEHQIVAVSDAKAEQMLGDFPQSWEDLGEGSPIMAAETAQNVLRCPLSA